MYALLRYNDFLRKQLAVYEPYRIGDKVQLENNSIWYVVADSDSKTDTVKLLSTYFSDVTGEGDINERDKVRYNTNNEAEYDVNDTNSVAYYMNGIVKRNIVDNIDSSIEDIGLLSAKEFVKIRERMNFGDEWTTSNWLAGTTYSGWWLLSEKNNKVYAVTSRGTFVLTNPNNYQFIRPVIVIKKDVVTKIEDKKQLTVDLINGLKR